MVAERKDLVPILACDLVADLIGNDVNVEILRTPLGCEAIWLFCD